MFENLVKKLIDNKSVEEDEETEEKFLERVILSPFVDKKIFTNS